MGEGFRGGMGAGRREVESAREAKDVMTVYRGARPLNQWRARSAAEPPRTISNRVVKRRSAEGTGGMPAGRAGPCAIQTETQADWNDGFQSPTRRGAVAARRAHNPKVGGSNPPAATKSKKTGNQ